MSATVSSIGNTGRRGFWARWKWLVISTLVITPLALGGYFIFVVYRYHTETVPGVYAQQDAVDIIIQHLIWHEGAWPRSWEDLEEAYGAKAAQGCYATFDNIKRLVEIDFTANPEELRAAQPQGDKPPFRVIWLRSGRQAYWDRLEPNRQLWERLQGQTWGVGFAGRLDPKEKQARAALIALQTRIRFDAAGRITEADMDSPVYASQYSDSDLRHLKDLPELQKLSLERSNITDAGLEQLKSLTSLRSIRLQGTKVTDDGVKRLQEALPNCKVVR